MKYYRLQFTLNSKYYGSKNGYVKDYIHKSSINDPKFIGKIKNEKIDFKPYLLDIEIFENSKIADLIESGGQVSTKLILSGKLKSIIEKHRKTGMQFFNINILQKKNVHTDYWILNMYEFNLEFINFKECIVYHEKKSEDYSTTYKTENIIINPKSYIEFLKYREEAQENMEMVKIEKLSILDSIDENFFMLKHVLGGIGYFVSETLKKEIEDAGCTGIEFQPVELSYNEWTAPGGVREQVYGKYF
ncbi:DUF1629 domain-containing protein [Flavobacterium filum]|uniref:imm11 family protein n=1 Tax=Flavobacterium filum TaxID=370974 RepID=UPI0023F20CC7|nr:DUF1629 domain-containing protein [Flavobacterium filum]